MKRKFFILRLQDQYKALSIWTKLITYGLLIGLTTLITFSMDGDTVFVFTLMSAFVVSIHFLLETPKNIMMSILIGAQFFGIFVLAMLYYNTLVINLSYFDPSLYSYALAMLLITNIILTLATIKYSKISLFKSLIGVYIMMDFVALGFMTFLNLQNMFIPFLAGAVFLIMSMIFFAKNKDKDYILSEKPIPNELLGHSLVKSKAHQNILELINKVENLTITDYEDHECIDFTIKTKDNIVYPVTILNPIESILVSGENIIFKGENINNVLAKIQYRGKQLIEDKEKAPYSKSILVNMRDSEDSIYNLQISSRRYRRDKAGEILLMSPEAFLKLLINEN